MNDKKYEILMDKENTIEWKGHTLHRIRALRDFGDIRKGDIGGFVENENNLSHKGKGETLNLYTIGEWLDYLDKKLYKNFK